MKPNKNFLTCLLILIFQCSCKYGDNEFSYICSSPFFYFFKVKDVRILKDINYDNFSEQKTYKPLYVFRDNLGIIYIEKNNLNFKIYNFKNKKEQNFSIQVPDFSNNDFDSYSYSFGYNSQYLLFCLKGNVYLGEIKHKTIRLKKIHHFDNTPNLVKVFDDIAFLAYFGYRSNIQGFTANTQFYILNFKDLSLKFIDLGAPHSFYFTLFYPPEVIDFSSKFIAHSDISPYKVKIYDKSGKLLFEIYKRDSLFREIDTNLHKKFTNLLKQNPQTVKPLIDSMRNTFFGGYGIIEKISFINDSVLLVRWYGPKYDSTSFYPSIFWDLWLIKDNTFLPIAKNIKVEAFIDTIPRICQTLLSSRYESGSNVIIKFTGTFSDEIGDLNEPIKKYLEREERNFDKTQKLILWFYEYF